jgi:hypothetical protein
MKIYEKAGKSAVEWANCYGIFILSGLKLFADNDASILVTSSSAHGKIGGRF